MPTDTKVNDLKINVLSEAQYEQIQSPSNTELYLVPETIDTTPTSGSTNPITSGGVYSALQSLPPQEQSDWNQSDSTADDYIKNKPQNIVTDANYVHTDNNYTTTEKNKLAGIENGAEVNVQSDWGQTDDAADDFIKNKPALFSGDYNDLTNKPTITDENVKQEPTSSGSTIEFPLLSSVTSTTDVTKTTTTRYSENLLMRGSDGSIILKTTADNTLDTPSLFFRRGSAYNAGTDWAIRSTGVETAQNTPLEFLRRYGSGSSSWVSKLSVFNNKIATTVTEGIESPQFVKTNPTNANGILLADGSDIPQSTFQPALPAYTNNAGKILAVNSNADGVVWISVIRIYNGSSAPSSSLGSDGDIYIQTQL